MKNPTWSILVSFALACMVLSTGCVSTVKPQTADAIAAAVQPIAKNVVNVVLTKNPAYDQALLALAAGADAAINGGQLTVPNIRAFVDALASKHKLDAHAKLLIASAIDDLVKFYQRTYGQAVADATDPNVRRILAAFAEGVRDGVAFFRALNAPPSGDGGDNEHPSQLHQ